MATFTVKSGDTARTLTYLLSLGDVAIDLSGSNVQLTIRHADGSITGGAATIVTAASGSVSYDLQATDTTPPGLKYMEFKITFLDGTILRVPTVAALTMDCQQNMSDPIGSAWPFKLKTS